MTSSKNPSCIYCKSSKVIKHGKTSNGNSRYRCRSCGKTWVPEKAESVRPDISDIVEAYLNGRTYRDLVSIYHSSPLRINQKIREFMDGCPDWENYIDACVPIHEPRLVHLVGYEFSCSGDGAKDNRMFLALAVDGLSSLVIGFEIATEENSESWERLLARMLKRGFTCTTFMAKGSEAIEVAVKAVFPKSSLLITYHRAYRDNELCCCLSRFAVNNKLINDAVNAYDTFKNHNLVHYLEEINQKHMKEILFAYPEMFIKRLCARIDKKEKVRVEGLKSAFQARFEKFHMIKGDPYPLINAWIAKQMLSRLDIGFSRLSLYTQIPSSSSFKNYACGSKPEPLDLREDSPLLRTFVIEIAARGLQIPVFYYKCEMKLDKCSLL
ncbi:MAG: hypothetical protein KAH48_05605 [Chlorobi bacterium]|nr:hypothetical protein [Chlorobiota bacterium]